MPRNDANQHSGYPPGPPDEVEPRESSAGQAAGRPSPPVVSTEEGHPEDQAQAEEARATKVSGRTPAKAPKTGTSSDPEA